jgi:hypothetical protein
MRFPLPLSAARRRAVVGGLALAVLFIVAVQGRAAAPIEKRLPDTTVALAKVQNAASLGAALRQSQLGHILDDPGIKAWKDDIAARWEKASQEIEEELGVNELELFGLAEGPVAIALLLTEEFDPSLVIAADAGKNTTAMNDVLSRVTARAERDGDKVSTESFHGVTIHVMQDGGPATDAGKARDKDSKKDKANDEQEDEDDGPDWPEMFVWACQGSVFWIGTDVATIKDLIAHEDGRDNALAVSATYANAVKTLGADTPVLWYVDLRKIVNLFAEDLEAYKESDAEHAKWVREFEAVAQQSGLTGLSAVVGSFAPCAGNVESLTRTTILLQGPAQGLLKAFRAPKVSLQPEPWVPASVASYQSFSWDLDEAFSILSALVNRNAPGLLDAIEKELAHPEGGQPLKFKQDIFDPLGDRITIISDFKHAITENSRPIHLTLSKADISFSEGDDARLLVAVALEDSRTFQNTLNTLFALAGANPRKREFLGTTIYDFELPDIPIPDDPKSGKMRGTLPLLKGPISVAIAKDALFISREPTLLEKVLRGGGPTLADSPAYRAFARETPDRVSSITYVRSDEQARLAYALFKHGMLETGLNGMAVDLGAGFALENRTALKEFPPFSVFTLYLAQGGRFTEWSEDRLTITSFALRKARP